jgi:hypothetical protein
VVVGVDPDDEPAEDDFPESVFSLEPESGFALVPESLVPESLFSDEPDFPASVDDFFA